VIVLDGTRLSDRTRARLIGASGAVIILLSAGAALLPVVDRLKGSAVVGALLLAAGIVEAFAGSLRHEVRPLAMSAGGVTAAVGLIFLLNPTKYFFPTVNLVIGWLVLRCVILLFASRRSHGSVRKWMTMSAAMDVLLAILLLAGLSIATLVISVFGPTPPLVASFAWVLALSFVVNGLLLLEVASCESETADA
jgi:hypothetical protein